MRKKTNLILTTVGLFIILLITIFQFESFFESFMPFSFFIPIILLGFISFGILNYLNLKRWQKILFTVVLTPVLFYAWIFIMIRIHGAGM